ncbi:histidine phosphatase family protein [Paenibacillus sp. J5C_2022]|uniref:histidine phosphatase family protein n=1 Tax=Paenibacillus sp. J5C2022 TaxID=2977129 RepID=UPI0021D1AE3F|nr:histidine phosphatase family protein [Paenibacillus sp. J5C2022]MCU6710375.1 histidine phosphatase family protein [Paenibacillus sp. J5C2022]
MELIFIRHGQGLHNTNIPNRLNVVHPSLTKKGREQVASLRNAFSFCEDDLFIVSPTVRTIETANILASGLLHPQKYISPLVGPRMYPLPVDPITHEVKCDWIYPLEEIQARHSDFNLLDTDDLSLWTLGINTIADTQFSILGRRMLSFMQQKVAGTSRAFIIAHDGTITNYRMLLGEQGLTRADFLGEAGWYRVEV